MELDDSIQVDAAFALTTDGKWCLKEELWMPLQTSDGASFPSYVNSKVLVEEMNANPTEVNGIEDSLRDQMDKRLEKAYASLAKKGLMRLEGIVATQIPKKKSEVTNKNYVRMHFKRFSPYNTEL